ncbi:MAG TPA: hypothetical protein VLA24_17920 [Pseudomonadales bacterium]|nr:hypothetical protein [Pseudomonadales bacterium]
MTRDDLLDYIKTTHGDALAQVGLTPVDTPESLSYSISDALLRAGDEKAEADRRVGILIRDRTAMLDIEPEPENIQSEGITDVSNL